jgi:hypothetical protein
VSPGTVTGGTPCVNARNMRTWLALLFATACGSTAEETTTPSDGGGGAGGSGGASPCTAEAHAVATVGTLGVGRYAPAAVVLPDGRALLAGGWDFQGGAQVSSELFDPASGAIAPSGSLPRARNFPATVLLPDGRVLVTGGFNPSLGSVRDTELYDGGTFTPAGTLVAGREAHTATLLPDGRVLVAGGLQAAGFHFLDSLEVFDPAQAGFVATTLPVMTAKRAFHAAALLGDGSVLLVGGDSGMGELASAERFTGTATVPTAGSRRRAGKAVAAAPLADGRVLVAGGANAADGTLDDADVYNPATDAFTAVAPMLRRRMAHSLTALPDGRVVAVGGWSDSSDPSGSAAAVEVYDPSTDTWELVGELAAPRHDHVALLLDGCRVLVAGGQHVVGGGAAVAPRELEMITIGD